ncbi:alanine racemase [Marmoricola sp. URHB0036]|uniref:alanine racemase n=1 Tax=Marmoricola sp. URHB0036 TaxID=1298863 RepID=UPI0003FA1219|nr:alanine racemase [Marmoricola sp. URHB0036]
MALTLHVNGDRWRSHLTDVLARNPGLVPVVKGNGYGFGLHRLARKAAWLGVDTLAVGTYDELAQVDRRYDGSLLVLTPWRPFAGAPADPRVIHTVGRLEDLEALSEQGRSTGQRPRVVLERMTSMLRHGFSAKGLREAGRATADGHGVEVEGVALHLPLAKISHLSEVDRLMTDVVAAGLDKRGEASRTIWVSHLTDAELATLAARYPDFTFRPRIGTSLWLGDRGALSVRSTVLDSHPVERGDTYGYRGRSAPRAGTILVVSGGTSHGIGLEAPTGDATLKARAASIARGGLDAAGFVRSPYTVGGKQRLFAEPPHMQASMLFIPAGSAVPAVGDEVECRVRFTATTFDAVELS